MPWARKRSMISHSSPMRRRPSDASRPNRTSNSPTVSSASAGQAQFAPRNRSVRSKTLGREPRSSPVTERGLRPFSFVLGDQRPSEIESSGMLAVCRCVRGNPPSARRDVVVGEDDQSSMRRATPGVPRDAQTLAGLVDRHQRKATLEAADHGRRIVGTIVIDEHKLPGQRGRNGAAGNRIQRDGEPAAVVPGAEDY